MKTLRHGISLLGILLGLLQVAAQPAPLSLSLEPLTLEGMPALQSFAWGQHEGNWLIVAGRTDGLHRRQPPVTFDSAGQHRNLVLVNPITGEVRSAPLTSLNPSLQEQLSATNLEFHQRGKYLYLLGGYGYSADKGDHTTFGSLIAIDVPEVLHALQEGRDFAPYFRQYSDSLFAVTGGQLECIGETFYLVGGQDFEGRYNPMGPTHGPGFSQTYNHRVRKFTLDDDGAHLSIRHFPSTEDTLQLHRRDYNMVPRILPDGQEGLTVFSGVFQYGANIPWYNCVDISPEGHRVITGFQQYYNHYHCPRIAAFSERTQEMHTFFFGGIAAYYDSVGVMTFNRDAPFVKTIARVTRTADGQMREYKLPIGMPAYLGASAEFIPNLALPHYPNGVLKLDACTGEKVLLGYIVGGIESKDDNVFWVNEGEHSAASSKIWKVYWQRNVEATSDRLNVLSVNPLELQVLPNAYKGTLALDFVAVQGDAVSVSLYKGKRKLLMEAQLTGLKAGPQHWEGECAAFKKGGVFRLVVKCGGTTVEMNLVVEP